MHMGESGRGARGGIWIFEEHSFLPSFLHQTSSAPFSYWKAPSRDKMEREFSRYWKILGEKKDVSSLSISYLSIRNLGFLCYTHIRQKQICENRIRLRISGAERGGGRKKGKRRRLLISRIQNMRKEFPAVRCISLGPDLSDIYCQKKLGKLTECCFNNMERPKQFSGSLLVHSPRLDAWNESCGGIFSSWADSSDFGRTFLFALTLSTA